MGSHPSAELVYGIYLGDENMEESILEYIAKDLNLPVDSSVLSHLETFATKHGLTETINWEDSGYILSASKTPSFSAGEDPERISLKFGQLPEIDPEDEQTLHKLAKELGTESPSWYLVAFYG